MSVGVMRERTARALRRARATYGDEHPATWAAYGRAIAAWGPVRVAPIAPPPSNATMELVSIATIACTRASSTRPGQQNRHARRRRESTEAK